MGHAAMDDGIGVGIIGIDAEGLREARAVSRLDRGKAKAHLVVARCNEPNPARAEHADAVVEDHVVIGPDAHGFFARTTGSERGCGCPFNTRSSSGAASLTPFSVS